MPKENTCHFCKKNQYQVKSLFQASKPRELICNECIVLGIAIRKLMRKLSNAFSETSASSSARGDVWLRFDITVSRKEFELMDKA